MAFDDEPFQVSAKTKPASLAGAINNRLKEKLAKRIKPDMDIQCIGAGAINQAVKAWAIARGYAAQSDFDVIGGPAFVDLLVESEEKTGIKFRLTLVQRD